jgi:uncharacterized protein involved in exopolysaccharide biosynthesis
MTVQGHDEEQVLTMRDLVVNYLQLAKRGIRYWMRGTAVFTLFFLIGMIWVVTRPRVYKSEARFQVLEADIPNQEQRNDEETTRSVENRLNQIFNSRRYILSIVQQYHLYDHLVGKTSEQKIADLFSGALDRRVERDIVALGFTYKDPTRAQQVVRALINLFVNERKMAATERAQETLRSVEAQERELSNVVAERQEALDRFILANQEMVERIRARRAGPGVAVVPQAPPEPVDERTSRRTRQLRAKLQQLQQQLDAVRNPGATPAPTASEPEEISQMRERVREKRGQVEGMRARGMTADHPTRAAAERELAEMENQLNGMIARHSGRVRQAENLSENDRARRIEDIQREINDTRSALADSERSDHSGTQTTPPPARADAGTGRLANIVEVETQYDRLTADLQTTRLSYSNILQRKFEKQAELRRIQLSGGESVRLIDPPSLPIEPEPPGRVKLASIVVFLALLLGLGTALISGFLDTRVYDMGDLRRWGELPELPFVPELFIDAPPGARASSVPPHAQSPPA